MSIALPFKQALAVISRNVYPVASNHLNIDEALGRITASAHRARKNYPPFSQSQYDGYAISPSVKRREGDFSLFHLLGEIAAGQSMKVACHPGEAYRIMTGAPCPQGAWKVIPQEYCRVVANEVSIPHEIIARSSSNIKKEGDDICINQVIVKKGTCLTPAMLASLSDTGVDQIHVHRKPRVAFFCSGSELIESNVAQKFGKKVSSNRALLTGLIRSFGCKAEYLGTVVDEPEALAKIFGKVMDSTPDIVLSTGGMGPGKYDLLQQSFSNQGGEVVFDSLKLRPGKSTLFGTLGGTLFFGLPGPPPAVFALFHGLIRPALLKMQGYAQWKQQKVTARLDEEIIFRRSGIIRLVEGITRQDHQGVGVRAAARNEYGDCLILCSARKKKYLQESQVKLLLNAPPPYLASGE